MNKVAFGLLGDSTLTPIPDTGNAKANEHIAGGAPAAGEVPGTVQGADLHGHDPRPAASDVSRRVEEAHGKTGKALDGAHGEVSQTFVEDVKRGAAAGAEQKQELAGKTATELADQIHRQAQGRSPAHFALDNAGGEVVRAMNSTGAIPDAVKGSVGAAFDAFKKNRDDGAGFVDSIGAAFKAAPGPMKEVFDKVEESDVAKVAPLLTPEQTNLYREETKAAYGELAGGFSADGVHLYNEGPVAAAQAALNKAEGPEMGADQAELIHNAARSGQGQKDAGIQLIGQYDAAKKDAN